MKKELTGVSRQKYTDPPGCLHSLQGPSDPSLCNTKVISPFKQVILMSSLTTSTLFSMVRSTEWGLNSGSHLNNLLISLRMPEIWITYAMKYNPSISKRLDMCESAIERTAYKILLDHGTQRPNELDRSSVDETNSCDSEYLPAGRVT